MIVKILIGSIVIGVLIGLASGDAVLGGVIANALFFTGLLVMIANALINGSQAQPPTAEYAGPVDPDDDLIEDVEFVFDEEKGELVEVPSASKPQRTVRTRPRRRAPQT